jgi:heme/copper-type cytochrome/quinol oxidase subunit 2
MRYAVLAIGLTGAAMLGGCSEGVLDPKGPIAAAERQILSNSLGIMLAIVIPTILATLGVAWWFRSSNRRARYRPDFTYSGRLELLVWSIPAMTVLLVGGVAWIGAHDLDPRKPLDYDTVKINYSVDLRLVADCVDAPVSDLQDLNPSLLRYVTPKDKDFELRLPAGVKDKYLTNIAGIPADMRPWWRYHKVGQDDTLSSIARDYRTTAKAIFTANELDTEELTPPCGVCRQIIWEFGGGALYRVVACAAHAVAPPGESLFPGPDAAAAG